MSTNHQGICVAALGAVLIAGVSQAGLVIDNFDQGSVNIFAGGGPAAPYYDVAAETGLSPENTIGGTRETHVQRGFGFFDYVSAQLMNGQMCIETDNDSQSWINYAAIGGRDFLSEGILGISLDIAEHSVTDLVVRLDVIDGYGNQASVTNVMGLVGGGSYQTSGGLDLEFAQLSAPVDLTNVDRLAITFAGTNDGLIVVEDIVAFTPEPGGWLAMFVMGGLAHFRLRRSIS